MTTDLSPTLQHQLEVIARLENQCGAARTKDLATELGCRMPTITASLRRLAALGLVDYRPYRPVTLTLAGSRVVRSLDRSGRVIDAFLIGILGMDPAVAATEGCQLEHRITAPVLEQLTAFVAFLDEDRKIARLLATAFRRWRNARPRGRRTASSCAANPDDNDLRRLRVLPTSCRPKPGTQRASGSGCVTKIGQRGEPEGPARLPSTLDRSTMQGSDDEPEPVG